MELAGKIALLTGATGGLGRAIAEALADRGASLVLSSRKAEELEQLAASLPGDGHRALVCDLADEGAGERLVTEAGQVDVLVANAGLPASGGLDRFSQEEIGRALRVNLEAPVRMTRELVPAMKQRGSGHLVYMSSLAGKGAAPRSSLYSATKFGLRGFALCLRQDLWGSGVGVSVVLPGFIREAGMFADSGARAPAAAGTSSPRDVAGAVVSAIERNRGEVEVAPLRLRAAVRFATVQPELAARISRGAATRTADQVAEGQEDKR